jgi:hypothetical protein
MVNLVKMLRRVLVLGTVATPHVPARKTQPQMNPIVSHLQALLATVAAWLDVANCIKVATNLRHEKPPEITRG